MRALWSGAYFLLPFIFFCIDRMAKYGATAPIVNDVGGTGDFAFFFLAVFGAWLFWTLRRTPHDLFRMGAQWSVIFGIFSNTIDQRMVGGVIDWIYIPLFGSGNIADGMIVVGAGALIVSLVREKK